MLGCLFECRFECLLGPVVEPVQRAAVDEGWEIPAAHTKKVSDRRHAQNDMEVKPELLDECLVNVILTWRYPLLFHELLERRGHAIGVLLLVQVRDLPSVQYAVDVFQELFVDDLRVGQEEDVGPSLAARVQQSDLHVFSEVRWLVILLQLDGAA